MNVGEELCGEWLRHVKGCEFLQYNIRLSSAQGEMDVLGINLARRIVYGCEVAIHLATGLQYVRDGQPDNVARLTAKLRKDVEFVRASFPEYQHVFMLWSPVVRNQRAGSRHNQLSDVGQVVAAIDREYGVAVEPMMNARFLEAIQELRAVASRTTQELDSSVMRFLQVEEHLQRHLGRAARPAAKQPAAERPTHRRPTS